MDEKIKEIIENEMDCLVTDVDFVIKKEGSLQALVNMLEAAINYTRCCDKLPKSDIILARYLHDSYELIAKKQDWNTQENCKVQFSDLPIENKNTMIFLAGKIIQDFGGN
tara:strand:- start:335 stop:664 length:330 start_codon:yes stop_codon:yes gene_type:complete